MLIISKYKDYYDGVVGTTGIDKTIVYNRDEVIIDDKTKYPSIFDSNNYWSTKKDNKSIFSDFKYYHLFDDFIDEKYYFSDNIIVGFCGKLYFGIRLYKKTEDKVMYLDDVIYNINEISKIMKLQEKNDKGKNNRRYNNKKKVKTGKILDKIADINNYNSVDIHREFNTPIFVFDFGTGRKSNVFIINPNLSSYKFYKVFDSFQTFQEIQMFMGGVLGSGEKEIIEIADKYKIEKYGFDKWSFRKEPKNEK